MILLGAAVNGAAIAVGGFVGLFAGRFLPDRLQKTLMCALALVVIGIAVPGIDAVMEHQRKRLEDRSRAVAMVAQVREKLTDTQFRRLWMYYVDGMTIDEIGAAEGVSHQAVSLNSAAAIRKIKKYF